MSYNIQLHDLPPTKYYTDDMHVGDIAVIDDNSILDGELVLKTHDSFINLSHPANIWHHTLGIGVHKLLPGEFITITIQAD